MAAKTSDLTFTENRLEITATQFIKYFFIHTLTMLISLTLAYNGYKEWMRHVVKTAVSPEIKLAIKATFPWVILIFVIIYSITALSRDRKTRYLPFWQYGVILMAQTVLMNLIFYSRGREILIVLNFSMVCLAVLLLIGAGVTKLIIMPDATEIIEEPIQKTSQLTDHQKIFDQFYLPLYSFLKRYILYIVDYFKANPFAYGAISSIALLALLMLAKKEVVLSFPQQQYYNPSVVMGGIITFLVLMLAFLICRHFSRTGKGLYGLIVLGLIELWYVLPRGYSSQWLYLKIIPLTVGLFVVWAAVREKWRLVTISGIIFLLSFVAIDLNAPYGFPDRYDPFTSPPYVEFLKKQNGGYRVVGGDGVLFPNFASAFGIQDVRHISALSTLVYHNYVNKCLHVEPTYDEASWSFWFTGWPILLTDKGDGKVVLTYRRLAEEVKTKLRYYSLLGVKYILLPATSENLNGIDGAEGEETPHFPLLYDKEIKIYENPTVFPRAFVVHQVMYAPTYKKAQEIISSPDFDLRNKVVLEEELPKDSLSNLPVKNGSSAIIQEYEANHVVIKARLDNPGILVLSDVFYPGWKAVVDGKPTKIYRVNGVIRGVFLDSGTHLVRFNFLPNSFLLGMTIFAFTGILTIGIWLVGGYKQFKITS